MGFLTYDSNTMVFFIIGNINYTHMIQAIKIHLISLTIAFSKACDFLVLAYFWKCHIFIQYVSTISTYNYFSLMPPMLSLSQINILHFCD